MSFVTEEAFQSFDKNISEALQRAETKLEAFHGTSEAMISELRSTAMNQQQAQGEIKMQMENLTKKQDVTDQKTEYLENQRIEASAKIELIDQMKEYLSQSET